MNICAVIMAAGEGKRMKSTHAKVVHKAAGKALVCWVRDALVEAGADEQVYIVGHRQEEVRAVLGEDVAFVLQEKQLGTGHAVLQASHFLESRSGSTLVLCGDAPLVTAATLRAVLDQFERDKCAAVIITADAPDPTGYGRIIRDDAGAVTAIVEHRDATFEQRSIREVNAGMYCFDTALLLSTLGKIGCRNTQQEYYLTDTIAILIGEGHRVDAYRTCFDEILGINDRIQLQAASRILNERILRRHMESGVTIIDPASTWIEDGVSIGQDVTILPGCSLADCTSVGEESVVGPDTHLINVQAGCRTRLDHVSAACCTIGEGADVGPYTHIRPGSRIGAGSRIGNFVEIKNSTIGAGTLIAHQCYIGDTDVGEGVNFGSGCSIANYDGLAKSRTTVGNHAFIGSNCSLVAPVNIADNAYVAAGSTITEDVPAYSLAIARSHQINKIDWVLSRGRIRGRRINP
jgi:bifunctional UDP-N-acetylglucosamine pyrophosphorylase/glucosamine-1-phosphate N-acetyltransferase